MVGLPVLGFRSGRSTWFDLAFAGTVMRGAADRAADQSLVELNNRRERSIIAELGFNWIIAIGIKVNDVGSHVAAVLCVIW